MTINKAYSGRLIFDHLPKTAGSAIHAWLLGSLGTGCVSPHFTGYCRDLVSNYGGKYSIICGHVAFCDDEFDPRYEYVTFIRNPVDRVISWLYFLINNEDKPQFNSLCRSIKSLLNSDGKVIDKELIPHISNLYVQHFCRIKSKKLIDSAIDTTKAFDAIKDYDLIGSYDDMPAFLSDLASLIGLPRPKEIPFINVTKKRPKVEQISHSLLEVIVELNQKDIQFYNEVLAWKKTLPPKNNTNTLTSMWQIYNPVRDLVFQTSDISQVKVVIKDGYDIKQGQILTFEVDFKIDRPVQELQAGIHILDENNRWAFGTNSTLQKKMFTNVDAGSCRVIHYLVADLPAGKYTAGFAFAECLADGTINKLAWYDRLCEFQVFLPEQSTSVGYVHLPADMILIKNITTYRFDAADERFQTLVGRRDVSCFSTTGQAGYLIVGPNITLDAGKYQVVIHGTVRDGGVAGAHMEVTADKGAKVLAAAPLQSHSIGDLLFSIPVFFDSVYTDLEVRVWVEADSDISVSLVEFCRCD